MESVAQWAESVLMTAMDLLRLPDDSWRYELVDGRLVRMSPTGGRHGRIVTTLLRAIDHFVQDRGLGEVFPSETGFWLSSDGESGTVLAPGIAFVRRGRDGETGATGYPRLAPDLVVEGASPSQGRAEMGAKARRCMSAGVKLVWVVLPEVRLVEIWRSHALERVLTTDEALSGGDVLPGFTYPISLLLP
jgi:Uma2 family endonuclease